MPDVEKLAIYENTYKDMDKNSLPLSALYLLNALYEVRLF